LPAILILYIFPSCILPQCQLIQMKMNGQWWSYHHHNLFPTYSPHSSFLKFEKQKNYFNYFKLHKIQRMFSLYWDFYDNLILCTCDDIPHRANSSHFSHRIFVFWFICTLFCEEFSSIFIMLFHCITIFCLIIYFPIFCPQLKSSPIATTKIVVKASPPPPADMTNIQSLKPPNAL
jgi:hypothetical protein